MDKRDYIAEFARIARENGRKARQWRKDGSETQAEWFAGRAGGYLTAARILKGDLPSQAWMRALKRRIAA